MNRIYLPPSCGYSLEGAHIKTDGTVRKKVSGTMMAGILGLSPWATPFTVACDLLGLAREDISGKPSVKTGTALESNIIKYAGKTYPQYGIFLAAEEIYEKRAGDHDSWVSDFDSDIFAGHVDGIVMGNDAKDYILEVKTSANLDAWTEGVPKYYYWQVALYNYFLTHQDKAFVVLGIVDEHTHADPNTWVANENTVSLFEMPFDAAEVEEGIAKVRAWYEQYIAQGITPDFDPSNPIDAEMHLHLAGLTDDVASVRSMVDELGTLTDDLDRYEAARAADYSRQEALRAKLKDYLDCHRVSDLVSTEGGYSVSFKEARRTKLSVDKLVAAGLKPEDFSEETVSKTLYLKKTKIKE